MHGYQCGFLMASLKIPLVGETKQTNKQNKQNKQTKQTNKHECQMSKRQFCEKPKLNRIPDEDGACENVIRLVKAVSTFGNLLLYLCPK